MPLLSRADRMMSNSLELVPAEPLNMLPSLTTALVLSNNRMSEVKKSSFSGLDLLKDFYGLCCLSGSC